jgi:predicted MFS family arabinose efflux permease
MTTSQKAATTPRQEWALLAVLAAVQFCNMVDFVIIMPLGPQFMRVFDISPKQFGWLVSSYTFAASISGLLIALVIDHFDRKSTLLIELVGFTVGTLLCAIAPNFPLLLAARIVAGAFGGVLAASVFSIVGDAVPESRRGAAMGTVMSAFAIASVVGIPFGLFLATQLTWHAPFVFLGVASMAVLFAAYRIIPSMRAHLDAAPEAHRQSAFRELREVIMHPKHLRAYSLSLLLTFAGFSVIPYISPYLVSNVGVAEKDLAYTYLAGGAFTLFSSRMVGKLSDRQGKFKTFVIMALLSLIPVWLLTTMPVSPLAYAIVVTTLFTMAMNARFVPATALIVSSVEPRHRGSFMSVNASVQHLGSGLAAILAGELLEKAVGGGLVHYDRVGMFSMAATLLSVGLARRLV